MYSSQNVHNELFDIVLSKKSDKYFSKKKIDLDCFFYFLARSYKRSIKLFSWRLNHSFGTSILVLELY